MGASQLTGDVDRLGDGLGGHCSCLRKSGRKPDHVGELVGVHTHVLLSHPQPDGPQSGCLPIHEFSYASAPVL